MLFCLQDSGWVSSPLEYLSTEFGGVYKRRDVLLFLKKVCNETHVFIIKDALVIFNCIFSKCLFNLEGWLAATCTPSCHWSGGTAVQRRWPWISRIFLRYDFCLQCSMSLLSEYARHCTKSIFVYYTRTKKFSIE